MDNYRDSYKKPNQVKDFLVPKENKIHTDPLSGTPNGHLNCHTSGCKKIGRFAENTFSQTWRCAFHHFGHD